MSPTDRRIIAVAAHIRRSDRCPAIIHSLSNGESFLIGTHAAGFRDIQACLDVRIDGNRLIANDDLLAVLDFDGDVDFYGFCFNCNERYVGRAGGGTTVTILDENRIAFEQFAV